MFLVAAFLGHTDFHRTDIPLPLAVRSPQALPARHNDVAPGVCEALGVSTMSEGTGPLFPQIAGNSRVVNGSLKMTAETGVSVWHGTSLFIFKPAH